MIEMRYHKRRKATFPDRMQQHPSRNSEHLIIVDKYCKMYSLLFGNSYCPIL